MWRQVMSNANTTSTSNEEDAGNKNNSKNDEFELAHVLFWVVIGYDDTKINKRCFVWRIAFFSPLLSSVRVISVSDLKGIPLHFESKTEQWACRSAYFTMTVCDDVF